MREIFLIPSNKFYDRSDLKMINLLSSFKEIDCIHDMKKSRHIVISEENYKALQKFGIFGESFDDIITKILKEEENGQPNL